MIKSIKICFRCKKEKESTDFYRSKAIKSGFMNECKECNGERNKKWRIKNKLKASKTSKEWALNNPERSRLLKLKSYLRRKYNITVEEFEKRKKAQQNRCLICEKVFVLSSQTHVDHNHSTKKVRGILCTRCNFIVGMVENEGDIILKSIEYIKRHELDHNLLPTKQV